MTQDQTDVPADRVLSQLAQLGAPPVPAELSLRIRAAALPALQPRPLHPAWLLAVAATTICYLGSALYFTARLF